MWTSCVGWRSGWSSWRARAPSRVTRPRSASRAAQHARWCRPTRGHRRMRGHRRQRQRSSTSPRATSTRACCSMAAPCAAGAMARADAWARAPWPASAMTRRRPRSPISRSVAGPCRSRPAGITRARCSTRARCAAGAAMPTASSATATRATSATTRPRPAPVMSPWTSRSRRSWPAASTPVRCWPRVVCAAGGIVRRERPVTAWITATSAMTRYPPRTRRSSWVAESPNSPPLLALPVHCSMAAPCAAGERWPAPPQTVTQRPRSIRWSSSAFRPCALDRAPLRSIPVRPPAPDACAAGVAAFMAASATPSRSTMWE